MNPLLKEDSILTIQLLSFDRPTEGSERFYFLEMSTLQATTLISNDRKINSITLFSYTPDNKYLNDQTIASLTTIAKFNTFFLNNEHYYVADCRLELEDGLIVSSHDDGEVSIEFIANKEDHILIENIFKKYGLDKSLIQALNSKPGYYFSIDEQSNIVAEYETFDDYVERRMKK